MYELSESRHNALNNAKDLFKRMSNNSLYVKWRNECIEHNAFYEGENQWPATILEQLRARGQEPIVINKIKPFINQLCGLEINTRSKFAYRVHSGRQDTKLLAKGLSHIGFYVQEDQDFSYKSSLMARDSIIGGVGWVRMYCYQGRYYLEYINNLNIVYDADDNSEQLGHMGSVAHMRYLSNNQLKMYWPKHAKKFDEINPPGRGSSSVWETSESFNNQSGFITSEAGSAGAGGGRLPVIEIQEKIPKWYYSGIDRNGYTFQTFDEEKAEKLAENKRDIEELMGTQIMRTVFYHDILLEYSPLYPNIPNLANFSYIPHVWTRRKTDGVLDGLVRTMKDVQREINYTKQKYLGSLNSARAVIDADAYQGQSLEDIRQEVRRPDGILIKNRGSEVDIIPNTDSADSYLRSSERSDYELQQVSGIYSDSLGDKTNAESGIAIKQRQIATAKNFASGFDSFKIVKKKQGKALLDLIQGGEGENIYVQILEKNEQQELFLNIVREVDGKQEIFNDIRTLPVDVYIESTPDYDSAPEEQQETLQALLANPNGLLYLQNEPLLNLLDMRHGDKIAAAMREIQQDKIAMEQGAQGGGQMPGPAQSGMGEVNPVNVGGMGNG
jgi:hypothetical protein